MRNKLKMKNILFKDECYQIQGALFEVYREKGCGFLESVYQECLELELELQGIPFAAKKPLSLSYKGRILTSVYQTDISCFGKIIIEIKALTGLTDEHRAQLQNYLKAPGLTLGLLVNFGHFPGVEIERIVSDKGRYAK